MIKKAVIEALKEFFSSDEGMEILSVVINRALEYEVKAEKTHPDGRTEIVTETRHALAAMLSYLSRTEGAIRGCQADAAAARNKATQTRDIMLRMAAKIYNGPLIEQAEKVSEIEYNED